MEHLLNLLWLVVATVLLVCALRGHRTGMLRCSLPVAIGCTLLLALVLFPALSMTDDLQRAKLDTETSSRHMVDTLQLGALDDLQHGTTFVLIPFLLLLILLASRLVSAEWLWLRETVLPPRCASVRPESARPPPFALLFA